MTGHGIMDCWNLLLICSAMGYSASSRSFTSGKKFISVFLQNYDSTAVLSLHIISFERPTTVNVAVLAPEFRRSVQLAANSTTLLTLDSSFMLSGNEISKKVITVTSNEDISLIMLNGRSKTYDSFLNLPYDTLGTTYYVVTYMVDSPYNIKQFAVANGGEPNAVTVRVAGSLIFNGTQYFDKERFSFTLEPHQAVQFQSDQDLTGTKLEATKPVAVFSGDQCITVPPSNCDHIAEQLYPVDKWSDQFIVFPLMKKQKKDVITVVSAHNATAVSVISQTENHQVLLAEGAHVNFSVSGGTLVNSSKPVMVTYLSTGGSTSMVSTFDPFLVNVIPTVYFSNSYVFVTIENLYNYILVVSASSSPSSIMLDGRPLFRHQTENMTFAQFTATRIYLGEKGGRHVISHNSTLFAIYIFGIGRAESYGYPMGNKEFPAIEGPWGALTCLAQSAVFTLPTQALRSAALSLGDVHLNDPTCQATQKDDNWVVIKAPFDGCGTTVINETGKIVYINTVYGTAPNTPIHRLKIKLMCEMSSVENVTFGFVPRSTYVSRLGRYNLTFSMYRSETYDTAIQEFPYETGLNRTLYVQMEAETMDSGVQIFTENCIASPSLTPSGLQYHIIENGCPKDATFKNIQSDDPRRQRFSFHVFKFDGHPQVFIICEVVICHRTSTPNRCTRGCLPSRRGRDLTVRGLRDKMPHLAQGPLVFTSDFQGGIASRTERSGWSFFVSTTGALTFGCVVTIVALVLQRKYYLRDRRDRAQWPSLT